MIKETRGKGKGKLCYDIFVSKRQLLLLFSLSVFFLVLIAIVGIYSMLKSVAIEPDVSSSVLSQKSSWEIKLSKSSYKVDELYPVDSSRPPIVQVPPGVSGSLVGPLNDGDTACEFDNGPQSSYLEKYEKGNWVRLCESTFESDSKTLGCLEYNNKDGLYVYGVLFPSKNCNDRQAPYEDGTYRLRTTVYAQCIPPNGKWHNVDPASCQIKEEVYSPEFTIYN